MSCTSDNVRSEFAEDDNGVSVSCIDAGVGNEAHCHRPGDERRSDNFDTQLECDVFHECAEVGTSDQSFEVPDTALQKASAERKLTRDTCSVDNVSMTTDGLSPSQLVKTTSGTFVVHELTQPGETLLFICHRHRFCEHANCY